MDPRYNCIVYIDGSAETNWRPAESRRARRELMIE